MMVWVQETTIRNVGWVEIRNDEDKMSLVGGVCKLPMVHQEEMTGTYQVEDIKIIDLKT